MCSTSSPPDAARMRPRMRASLHVRCALFVNRSVCTRRQPCLTSSWHLCTRDPACRAPHSRRRSGRASAEARRAVALLWSLRLTSVETTRKRPTTLPTGGRLGPDERGRRNIHPRSCQTFARARRARGRSMGPFAARGCRSCRCKLHPMHPETALSGAALDLARDAALVAFVLLLRRRCCCCCCCCCGGEDAFGTSSSGNLRLRFLGHIGESARRRWPGKGTDDADRDSPGSARGICLNMHTHTQHSLCCAAVGVCVWEEKAGDAQYHVDDCVDRGRVVSPAILPRHWLAVARIRPRIGCASTSQEPRRGRRSCRS